MIEFKNVRKRYRNGYEALKGIDLHIDNGELLFLTGHSGAGKSTLLKLIAALEHPSSGSILFHKTDLAHLSNRQIPYHRRRIGVIFQNPTLLSESNVFDNVALPLRVTGYSEKEINHRVNASLELVGLSDKADQVPEVLSGGEQQRTGIARAIVSRPEVILADEPTGNLDPNLSLDIMNLFMRLNQVGITLIIATHDLSLIGKFKYRKINLKAGQIESDHQVSAA